MCLLVLLASLTTCVDSPAGSEGARLQRFQRTETHMGTAFGIVLYAADERSANRALDAAFARVAEIDRICSDYSSESELSRLSAQSPTPKPIPVSDELYTVLRFSRHLSERTGGAFDVTLGPATKLWRRARLLKKLPAADRLDEVMSAVGYQHLVVHPTEPTVELLRPKMRLDLGAVAKGYACDEALRILRDVGCSSALVNGGGDLSLGDPPPEEPAWPIDIAPLEPGGKPSVKTWLANQGIATSGDAFQFVEIEGKRYSHILDPRTGYGVKRRFSVSVIAPTGMAADGLATAVSVLGPEAGLKLVEETPEAAAYIVAVEDGQVRTYQSKRFSELTKMRSR